MRWFIKVVAVVVVVAALGALGVGVYQSGVAAGLAQASVVGAPGVGPYGPWAYGAYPWGHRFGGFHLLGTLFFLFLIFALLRAAVRGRFGGYWGHGLHGGQVRGPWEEHLRRIHDAWHREGGDRPTTDQSGSVQA